MDFYLSFMLIFNYLPIAAIVDEKDFCVHGGLCREIFRHGPSSIQHLFETIKRPITVIDSSLVFGLLWADPMPDKDNIPSIGFAYKGTP